MGTAIGNIPEFLRGFEYIWGFRVAMLQIGLRNK
jgi:hypothetical protein